jgi:hypothetical protein
MSRAGLRYCWLRLRPRYRRERGLEAGLEHRRAAEAGPDALDDRGGEVEREDALLDAAWDELREVGYARLTMEGIAQRARTSRPVLARRWPTRHQLVVAALRRHRPMLSGEVPDTGSPMPRCPVTVRRPDCVPLTCAGIAERQASDRRRVTGRPSWRFAHTRRATGRCPRLLPDPQQLSEIMAACRGQRPRLPGGTPGRWRTMSGKSWKSAIKEWHRRVSVRWVYVHMIEEYAPA